MPFIETEHEILREYGFYVEADGDPESFLAEYIASLKKETRLIGLVFK